MFLKSSLHVASDMGTKRKQEAIMSLKQDDPQGAYLLEDLAGMAALIVLLVLGLHLPVLS